MRSAGILASEAISLNIIADSDISKEKNATGIFRLIEACAAIVRARAVFPTEGLAPMTMNSDF